MPGAGAGAPQLSQWRPGILGRQRGAASVRPAIPPWDTRLDGRAYCRPGRPLQTTLSEFAAAAKALGLAKLEAKDSA